METGRGSVKLFCEDGMGWEGGGRPGVGELDPAATAATLSPGGVMITTPAGPSRARPAPFFLSSCGHFAFTFYLYNSKIEIGFYAFNPTPSAHGPPIRPAGGRAERDSLRCATLLRRCGEPAAVTW